jgi:hypothetical protein
MKNCVPGRKTLSGWMVAVEWFLVFSQGSSDEWKSGMVKGGSP